MLTIAISLFFGIAAITSAGVIHHSLHRAFATAGAIRAELADMQAAEHRLRALYASAPSGRVVTRRAGWSRPAARPLAWSAPRAAA